MDEVIERETMEFDVVIVGAGPAGLAAAIRLKQLAAETGKDISVVVLEKGSQVGAHILSGAVIDPVALDRLLPDWREQDSPLQTEVSEDRFYYLTEKSGIGFPSFLMPPLMSNHGCYIGSLGSLCRWLGEQAEAHRRRNLPRHLRHRRHVRSERRGRGRHHRRHGRRPRRHAQGQLHAWHRAHRQVHAARRRRARLAHQAAHQPLQPRRRERPAEIRHRPERAVGGAEGEASSPGLVQHTMGWPLHDRTGGGSFLYHFGENLVSVGFVVHLDYANPYINPFKEFQRAKLHPRIASHLEGGRRISYGARALTEGGWQAIPRLAFPGGALIGCGAGFMNVPRIKGSHNAMLSGMMAAEAAFAAIGAGRSRDVLDAYEGAVKDSSMATELKRVRNVKPLWSRSARGSA